MSHIDPGHGPGILHRFVRLRPVASAVSALAAAAVLALVLVLGRDPAAADPPSAGPTPPATRVVSLVPALTEVVVALGATNRLVGRTRYDRGETLTGLPSVGGSADPDLEGIVALEPDLVVTWRGVTGGRTEAHLRAAGIAVHSAAVESLDDLLEQTLLLGRRLGREARAAALREGISSGLAALARNTAGSPRPSVLVLLHPDPPLSAGPGTYLHELIGLSGGRNAFPDAGRWPILSVEAVVSRDPDAIVVSARDGERPASWLRHAPGWRDLRAVRRGRVLALPARRLTHPGPGVVGLAEELAAFLRATGGEDGT